MLVHKNNLEKGFTVLAPTIGIPAALKSIDNKTKIKRSIKTGKAEDEISSAKGATRLRQFTNSEDKENVRPSVVIISPEPVCRSRQLTFDTDYVPSNGQVCSPREVVHILEPMGRGQWAALMKEWIRKELLPINSLEGLRKVLRKSRAGKPIADCWGKRGTAIISIAVLGEEMARHLAENVGMTVNSSVTEKLLIARKKLYLSARGRDPSNATVDRKTLSTYHAAITFSHPGFLPIAGPSVTILPPIEKTNTRQIVERSLISVMMLVLVVLTANFQISDKETFLNLQFLTVGAQKTTEVIRAANPDVKM
jgi:hypothetical protein